MDFISRRLKKRFAKNKDGERIASHGMIMMLIICQIIITVDIFIKLTDLKDFIRSKEHNSYSDSEYDIHIFCSVSTAMMFLFPGMSSKPSQKPLKTSSGVFESASEPPSRVDLRR